MDQLQGCEVSQTLLNSLFILDGFIKILMTILIITLITLFILGYIDMKKNDYF